MPKTEVWVPFDGKRDALVAYFENMDVIRVGGIPVTEITLPADADEEDVRDIAVDFAYGNQVDGSEWVIGETDFFDVFEVNGEPVGWNIDLSLWDKETWDFL